MIDTKALQDIAKHYGKDLQLVKAQEELGEACAAIARYQITPSDKNWNELVGEIADAFNMLDQITFLLGAQTAVNHVREHKIFRQSMRIRKEKLAA